MPIFHGFATDLGREIVPVEVKAGATGHRRSLQVFLREKRRSLGVRFSSAPASLIETTTGLPDGAQVPFRLLSLPLYMAGLVHELLADVPRPRG